jgi:hypothetical protein
MEKRRREVDEKSAEVSRPTMTSMRHPSTLPSKPSVCCGVGCESAAQPQGYSQTSRRLYVALYQQLMPSRIIDIK